MRRARAVVVFVIAGSCLVARRSEDFACETATDCAAGRACSPEGYCIVDENVNGLDCDDDAMECSASCSNSDPCIGPLSCPAGYDCHFNCDSPNSCLAIDCTNAGSCTVNCTAPNACGTVVCSGGDCDIECNGQNACGLVNCSGSCRCDVDCDGGSGCTLPSSCPTIDTCTDGELGCDSSNGNCDSC